MTKLASSAMAVEGPEGRLLLGSRCCCDVDPVAVAVAEEDAPLADMAQRLRSPSLVDTLAAYTVTRSGQ